MIAVKNNKIILQGLRNRQDDIWEIPVPKHNITAQCCIQPHIHIALHRKLVHKTKRYHHTAPKKPRNAALPSHLQNLSELASTIDFDNAIHQQLQYDKTTTLQPETYKANIILRKKETHMNLV